MFMTPTYMEIHTFVHEKYDKKNHEQLKINSIFYKFNFKYTIFYMYVQIERSFFIGYDFSMTRLPAWVFRRIIPFLC